MICVAVQDDFVLKQDLCVMCGSLGNDFEGRLIACTQCGQCYHPHCVNIRVILMNLIFIWFSTMKFFIMFVVKLLMSKNFLFILTLGNYGNSAKRLEMPWLHGMWGLWRETRRSKFDFMRRMWHIISYILFRSSSRSSASGYMEV
jgi:hypothetical protein